MDILLDTHIALWALDDSPKLPERARELILDSENRIFVSDLSAWEVALKHLSRPDVMPSGADRFLACCEEAGYLHLPLLPEHIVALESLDTTRAEGVHKDPFDRMLVAQAKCSRMLLVTHDRSLELYSEPLVAVL